MSALLARNLHSFVQTLQAINKLTNEINIKCITWGIAKSDMLDWKSRRLLAGYGCWKAEVLLFETIGQCSDIIKSKMAARKKIKSDNNFNLL